MNQTSPPNRLIFLEDSQCDSALFRVRGHANWGVPAGAPLGSVEAWHQAQGWASPREGAPVGLTLMFQPRADCAWAAHPLTQVVQAWDAGAPLDLLPWVFHVPSAPGLLRELAFAAAVLAAGGLRARRRGLSAPSEEAVEDASRSPVSEWASRAEELAGSRESWPRTTPCGGGLLRPGSEFLSSWAVVTSEQGDAPVAVLRRGALSWGPVLAPVLGRGAWRTGPWEGSLMPSDEASAAALSDLFAFLGESLQGTPP